MHLRLSTCHLISTLRVGWESRGGWKRNVSIGFNTISRRWRRHGRSESVGGRRQGRGVGLARIHASSTFLLSFSFSLRFPSLFSFSPASIPLFWLINPFKSRGFMSSRGHADFLSLSLFFSLFSVCLCSRFLPTRKLAFVRWPTVSDGFQKKKKKNKTSRDPGRFLASSRLFVYTQCTNNTGHSRIRDIYVEAFSFHEETRTNLTNESSMNY